MASAIVPEADSGADSGAAPPKTVQPATTFEERTALVDTLRRLLADKSDEASVRATMAGPTGFDPALWKALGELGLTGLLVSTEDGGAGFGALELELVAEELGATLACVPFLASSVLAVGLLQALGVREGLSALADGSEIATVALTGSKGGWTAEQVGVEVSNGQLSGVADFVLDAQIANRFYVVTKDQAGIAIFEVPAGAAGLSIHALDVFDQTRRLSRLTFNQTPARKIGTGWAAVEAALDLARIALAGEQAGGGRVMLEKTVDYARQRYQFGRAIGSFQAIKHMAADLLIEKEGAISAARYAAEQYDEDTAEKEAAIALASFVCADSYVKICADSIQMHGGIGFTWEHPAHLYFKRAKSAAKLFGSSDYYRELFVQKLGG